MLPFLSSGGRFGAGWMCQHGGLRVRHIEVRQCGLIINKC